MSDDQELLLEEAKSALSPEDNAALPGCPFWMVTFGDVVSLLMTFFVLLLSFTDISQTGESLRNKFVFRRGSAVSQGVEMFGGEGGDGVRVGSGSGSEGKGEGEGGDDEASMKKMEQQLRAETLSASKVEESNFNLNMSYKKINKMFNVGEKGEGSSGETTTEENIETEQNTIDKSFEITFKHDELFKIATVEWTSKGYQHISKIGKFISSMPNDILIVGYGDDLRKTTSSAFTSPAVLGVARANAVAELFKKEWLIDPERISIRTITAEKATYSFGKKIPQVSIRILSEFNGVIRKEMKAHEERAYKRRKSYTDGNR